MVNVLSLVILNRQCENKSLDMYTNENNCASYRNIVPHPEKTEFFEEGADYPILLCSQTDNDVLIASLFLHVV